MDEFWGQLEEIAAVIDDCIATVYDVANVVYLYVGVSVIVAFAVLVMLVSILRNQSDQKARIDQLYKQLEGRDNERISNECDKRD